RTSEATRGRTRPQRSDIVLRTLLALAAVSTLLAVAGCRSPGERVLPAPGPIWYQQQQAVLHDPYPDNDLGPAMTGVRPPSYDRPAPEATRSKYYRESWWGRQ